MANSCKTKKVWYVEPEYNDDAIVIKKVVACNATEALKKAAGTNRRPKQYREGFYVVESKYDKTTDKREKGLIVFTKEGAIKHWGEKEALEQFQYLGVADIEDYNNNRLWYRVDTEYARKDEPDIDDDNHPRVVEYRKALAMWEASRPKSLEDIK